MKWKIHKENSEDLGFAISCFFKRAITIHFSGSLCPVDVAVRRSHGYSMPNI